MFLNQVSLSFLDDMFYRLPFPDLQVLEKLQEELKLSAAVAKFRDLVQADLSHPRAMDDLHRAWLDYLTTEIKSKGGVNPGWRRSESLIEERNKTPTQSDIEVIVCFHWYTSSVKSI